MFLGIAIMQKSLGEIVPNQLGWIKLLRLHLRNGNLSFGPDQNWMGRTKTLDGACNPRPAGAGGIIRDDRANLISDFVHNIVFAL
ncbi:hypothetical protein CDL15_Pgr026053 [Punica granatum]|uniref:Uncharacterized protein n=1 Tax=Punica granatum TaxID=22663 RepID=A0A218WCE8_PUNGR|nr:hypothetical protein CDL15_Pgr026053 [Punica granatum]